MIAGAIVGFLYGKNIVRVASAYALWQVSESVVHAIARSIIEAKSNSPEKTQSLMHKTIVVISGYFGISMLSQQGMMPGLTSVIAALVYLKAFSKA